MTSPRVLDQPPFLPMTLEECASLGWDALDVLLVTGDAYVDHPSFGVALLGRWLVSLGWRVGIIAQPRWDTVEDVTRLGCPRLFAGVTAGALDSMLAHYTAFRKIRHDDAYTPGGLAGRRPNRACIVYTGLLRQAFPGLAVVLGGIEASMRRASHYDFWSSKVRRSIILDSKADGLIYGMGERAVATLAARLASDSSGFPRDVPGMAFALGARETWRPSGDAPVTTLPSHEEILERPMVLMDATLAMERQVHQGQAWAAQSSGGREVWMAPPAASLEEAELDAVYALPYARRAHPSYNEPVPSAAMIQFSVTSHRGCGGGCSFCSLALHQGRRIQSRSKESIASEIRVMTSHSDWKGAVSDVGGPSANMWGTRCVGSRDCNRASCLTPKICPSFASEQSHLLDMLNDLADIPGVRHVRIASGVRHDLALECPDYARELAARYTGGQLKLAPEHMESDVLSLMRKPGFEIFERFLALFEVDSRNAGKEQYIIPYLMSAFPGCTDDDMRRMARWFHSRGWRPRQVQCFIPLPGTVAAAMFYAGVSPQGDPIFVARTDAERLRQHAILLDGADAAKSAPSSRRKR